MSDYKRDYTLETLLDLDGMIVEVGQGLWAKINAKRIKNSIINRPFGIKYSLITDLEEKKILQN